MNRHYGLSVQFFFFVTTTNWFLEYKCVFNKQIESHFTHSKRFFNSCYNSLNWRLKLEILIQSQISLTKKNISILHIFIPQHYWMLVLFLNNNEESHHWFWRLTSTFLKLFWVEKVFWYNYFLLILLSKELSSFVINTTFEFSCFCAELCQPIFIWLNSMNIEKSTDTHRICHNFRNKILNFWTTTLFVHL
jgi:hypothetical protein